MEDGDIKRRTLKKAVKEYYSWHGESKAAPVSVVRNKKSGFDLVLVRFVSEDGVEMSSLVDCQPWNDGHYTIEELFDAERECEDKMVNYFVQSEDYV